MRESDVPGRQAAAFEAIEGARNADLLLLCDHASNAVPPGWGTLGLSQEQLADMASMDRTYVGGIERGERNPSLKNLARLASALQLSLSKLLEGVPND